MIAQGRLNDASVCDPALPPDPKAFASKVWQKKQTESEILKGGRGGEVRGEETEG
jgi:hypothetical protein